MRNAELLGGFTKSWRKKQLGGASADAQSYCAGTLRCLRPSCHTTLFSWSRFNGVTVGALPQTPPEALPLDSARGRRKGTKSPLDPFARLSWLLFPVPLACGFLVLRLNYYFPHSGRGYSPSSALRSIALATTALSSWYVTPYQRSGQVSTRAVARWQSSWRLTAVGR